jgi:hypothetical protein
VNAVAGRRLSPRLRTTTCSEGSPSIARPQALLTQLRSPAEFALGALPEHGQLLDELGGWNLGFEIV